MWGIGSFLFPALLACASLPVVADATAAPRAAHRDTTRQLVEDECTQCHEFDRVARQHLSKAEWRGVIRGMVDEGPPLTSRQFAAVLDYLARHYGPEEPYKDGREAGKESQ